MRESSGQSLLPRQAGQQAQFRPDVGKTQDIDSRRGMRAYHRGTTIAPFVLGAREPRSRNQRGLEWFLI